MQLDRIATGTSVVKESGLFIPYVPYCLGCEFTSFPALFRQYA